MDKVFFALIGLLIIAKFWSRFSLGGLRLTRDTKTDRAQVGQPLLERVRIENRSRIAKLWVELIDHSDLPGHRVSRVVHLGANDATRWRVETICARRGRFRIGPMTLRSGDPFGLFPMEKLVPDTVTERAGSGSNGTESSSRNALISEANAIPPRGSSVQ